MNKERLLKLADHLENGILGHQEFNFRVLNYIPRKTMEIKELNYCGTQGCAIGECPIVFPNDWEFDNHGDPVLKISPEYDEEYEYINETFFHVDKFFDIDKIASTLLFVPADTGELDDDEKATYNYSPLKISIANEELIQLLPHATKQDVANQIRKFVELKEKEINAII